MNNFYFTNHSNFSMSCASLAGLTGEPDLLTTRPSRATRNLVKFLRKELSCHAEINSAEEKTGSTQAHHLMSDVSSPPFAFFR